MQCGVSRRRVHLLLILLGCMVTCTYLGGLSFRTCCQEELEQMRVDVWAHYSVEPHLIDDVINTAIWSKSNIVTKNSDEKETVPDFLLDDESLSDHVAVSSLEAANISTSKIFLLSPKTVYEVGDVLLVGLEMYDGYGIRRSVGGDHIRIRLYETAKGASTSGRVIDHRNGTYTAEVTLPWAGTPSISIELTYPRQLIRGLFYIRKVLPGTRQMMAIFTSTKGDEELSLCSPRPTDSQYKEFCNLTADNYGMSWYCGKPTHKDILCNDWTETHSEVPSLMLPFTAVERSLLKRPQDQKIFPTEIAVNVKGPKDMKTKVPCSSVDRRQLWNHSLPFGYFYGNSWNMHHCSSDLTHSTITECLRNKQLYLFGDSTTRYWYMELKSMLNCEFVTTEWNLKMKWSRPTESINKTMNFRLKWMPHAQPSLENRHSRHAKAISAYIDEIGDEENVVVLVHVYLHMVPYDHSIFEDRVRIIRRSVQRLLKRNSKATVLVKGPHTFWDERAITGYYNDYYAYLYRDILTREFRELEDKVVFLDYIGMTIAANSTEAHPKPLIVSEMVKQMLSFTC